MEQEKILATEQVAENVEQTTEETPKTYTQEEVDAIVGKKIARTKAKLEKKYEKYGELENVLKAGTGKEDVEEIADSFRSFYSQKGINVPQKQNYTDRDVEVLARAEAEDIIRAGYDEVVEEVDRLTAKGAANMTAREKALFKTLAEHRNNTERSKALKEIGVTEDVYSSKEFTEFAAKFNSTTPIKDIYDIYSKTQPKKEFKTMGSMKNSISDDSGVKEFYTPDEAKRFTQKEINDNPALVAAIERSMLKW